MEIESLQSQVAKLLKDNPNFRDDDRLLVVNFWYGQLVDKKIDPKKISASTFLVYYLDGHLTNSDLITRARRKVQEENPELRGKNWNDRHKQEKEYRNYFSK
jgi:hypothetical protein